MQNQSDVSPRNTSGNEAASSPIDLGAKFECDVTCRDAPIEFEPKPPIIQLDPFNKHDEAWKRGWE